MEDLVVLASEQCHAGQEQRAHALASAGNGRVDDRVGRLGVLTKLTQHEVRGTEVVLRRTEVLDPVALRVGNDVDRRLAKGKLVFDIDTLLAKVVHHGNPDGRRADEELLLQLFAAGLRHDDDDLVGNNRRILVGKCPHGLRQHGRIRPHSRHQDLPTHILHTTKPPLWR